MSRATVACARILTALGGCVSVTEVKGPDGKTALAVRCGNATNCYKKAGELCPNGYDFVGNNSESYVGGTNGSVYGGTATTLVVECKTPATTKN